MKIKVNNRTVLLFPTSLVVNRFSAVIFRKKLKNEGIHITQKQLLLCLKEFKRYKRKHPDWDLIEVSEKDGTTVTIKI